MIDTNTTINKTNTELTWSDIFKFLGFSAITLLHGIKNFLKFLAKSFLKNFKKIITLLLFCSALISYIVYINQDALLTETESCTAEVFPTICRQIALSEEQDIYKDNGLNYIEENAATIDTLCKILDSTFLNEKETISLILDKCNKICKEELSSPNSYTSDELSIVFETCFNIDTYTKEELLAINSELEEIQK